MILNKKINEANEKEAIDKAKKLEEIVIPELKSQINRFKYEVENLVISNKNNLDESKEKISLLEKLFFHLRRLIKIFKIS